jgi:hypothetical protein
MKFRSGFVSNSSSSSFICEVCGDTFEAYNEGIAYFNLFMCEQHDHLFCGEHRINPIRDADGIETFTMYEDEDDGDDRIDSIHCPICQLKTITENMLFDYALHKLNDVTRMDLKSEINTWFTTYDELYDEIKNTGSEYHVELTGHATVKAANEECAYRKARAEIVKNPVRLDVTHCE